MVSHAFTRISRYMKLTTVALAIFFGFVAPTLIGLCWNDPVGAFVYGGLTSKLASMPLDSP